VKAATPERIALGSSDSRSDIEIIVVDDHDIVGLGLANALARDPGKPPITIAGRARELAGLRDLLTVKRCDVVVLDLLLDDGSNPAETVAELISQGLKVLIYSIAADAATVRRALAAGAHGLSRKSEPVPVTLSKIRAVVAGEQMISPDILAMIDGDTGFVEAKLSERERQVLIMYVSGLEVPQIARQIYVTADTAKQYLRRIRAKYSELDRPAPTKVELLHRAIEDGIIPPILPK
jgi:DNA-binding NarL/FixJ family response regulator